MMLPLILAPMLIYGIFYAVGFELIGLLMIAVLGILGILFRNPLLEIAERKLIANKYKLGTSFRK